MGGYAGGALSGQTALGNSDAFAARLTATTGELSIRPQSLNFSALQGSPPVRQAIQISAAGGTVSWTASVRLLNGAGWLTVTPSSGTTAPNQPTLLAASVDYAAFSAASLYQAAIVIRNTGSGSIVTLPVTATVSTAQPRLQLGQSSLVFRSWESGQAPPAQRLRIGNNGTGTLNWTIDAASVPVLQTWLRISTLSGATGAGQFSTLGISMVPEALNSGVYQALVPISAPGAANNPQLLTVTVQVVPATTPPEADITPRGFIFLYSQGGATPPSQTLTVSNGGQGSVGFQWQATTASGGNWLSVSPSTGSAAQAPVPLQVSANPANLSPGIYRGTLTGKFTPTGTGDLDVVLVVAPAGAFLQRNDQRAANCAPQTMEMISTAIGNGSALPLSFPRALTVMLVDNCGAEVNNASVVASVEGRNIVLNAAGGGVYSGNWVPERESASVAVVFYVLHATLPPLQRTVTVSTAPPTSGISLPILLPDGVVEGAGFTPRQPLAPGGIISVFGSRFAAADTFASRLPLERDLSGVSLRIGGEVAPLYFAGPGQINAQVPYSVRPGDAVSIVVNANGRLTAPQSYPIAPVQPGVFVGGEFAAVLDGQSRAITAGNPARIGDTLQIFTTGLGVTDPPAETGAGAPSFSTVMLPVTVLIGGVEAPVVYQGLAPGFVGLYQVNVVLPSSVTPGNAVPLVIRQNGIESNPNRTTNIPVQGR